MRIDLVPLRVAKIRVGRLNLVPIRLRNREEEPWSRSIVQPGSGRARPWLRGRHLLARAALGPVHHIHGASMPELAPYVSDEQRWREHRKLYGELFRKPKTFLFLAGAGGELVRYALGTSSARPSHGGATRGTAATELANSNRSPCYPSIAGPGSAQRCSMPSTPSSRDSASTIR